MGITCIKFYGFEDITDLKFESENYKQPTGHQDIELVAERCNGGLLEVR